VRQRVLTAINPVVTTVVTVALAAAGTGYWCFVIGLLAGGVTGALVCTLSSPYPLRLRIDRATVREYASFSLPLFGSGVSALVVIQGGLIVANTQVGLAGIGAIGLAVGFAAFAERVDSIVSATIYPAVVAAARVPKLMFEAFVKSNRLALMWALPFGTALALFAPDLVDFVLGERWEPATGLIAATGLIVAFGQLAFNWTVFMRAVNRTGPIFVVAVLDLVVFAVVWVPAMLVWGLTGWAVGLAALTFVQIIARSWYMTRLFQRFDIPRQLVRAVAPVLPAAALILALRAVFDADRTLALAIGELALYSLLVVAFTALLERRLLREVLGYLRGRTGAASGTITADA
jgi:PST family polysaccharide transporter